MLPLLPGRARPGYRLDGIAICHLAGCYGNMTARQVKVDRCGRIVIPKPVRDALGLRPGSTLTLSTRGEAVLLQPAQDALSLERDGGVWVAQTEALADLVGFERHVRRARLDDLAG